MKVDGNDLDASRHTAPKRGNPFRAVFPPQEDPVSFLASVLVEENDETADEFAEIEIGEFPGAIAVVIANGFAVSKRPDIVEQLEERFHEKETAQTSPAGYSAGWDEARGGFLRTARCCL